MIQPGHGTVLYNKEVLHLACVASAKRVDFKVCTQDGTVVFQDIMDMGASVDGWSYYIFYKEIAVRNLVSDTDYYVTYWYEDFDTKENTVIFNAFVYRPNLAAQYEDYPYIGNWITQTELDNAESNINSNTNNRSNEIKADIKTSYLGNKKLEMTYCETVPSPNPRNLFVGCEDYVTEIIKADSHSDWTTPISTKIVYYWYDADKKRIKVGEE